MADRDVVIRFIGDTSQLTGPVDKATTSVDKLSASGTKASASIESVAKSGTAAGQTVPTAFERASTSMGNVGVAGEKAAAKVEASTGRAASAARALGNDLGQAAGQALSFGGVMGPLGLALGAGAIAIGLWASGNRKATEEIEAHKKAVADLTAQIDGNTLSLSDNARAQVDQQLATQSFSKGQKDTIAQSLAKLQVDQQAFAAAIKNGPESSAFKFVNDQLQQQAQQLIAGTTTWKTYGTQLEASGFSLKDVTAAILAGGDAAHNVANEISVLDFAMHGAGASTGSASAATKDLNGSLGLVGQTYDFLDTKTKDFAEAQAQQIQQLKFGAADAAVASGASVDIVNAAIDRFAAKGGTLQEALLGVGATTTQTDAILKALGITTDQTSASFAGLTSAAYQAALATRNAISTAASGFINPVSAYDAAVQFVNAPSGSKPKAAAKPKIGDDPAVKAASAALKAYERQRQALNQVASDASAAAKTVADAEKAKADAAQATATRLAKIAEASRKAADDAESAIQGAKDKQAQANRDASDAASVKAAIDFAALRAGSANTFAHAQELANKANTAAAREAAQATGEVATAQAAATVSQAKAASDQRTAASATARAAALDREATAAKDAYTRAQEHAAAVQRRTTAEYQKLLDRKSAAEDKARAATEAFAAGVADAVGGIADQVKPSLQQYLDQLDKQVNAQKDWKNNLLIIASKISPGMALELAKLGPAAAPIIAQLVTGTSAQMKQFVSLFSRAGTDSGKALGDSLTTEFGLLDAIAHTAGKKVADSYAAALRAGKITVAQAVAALNGTVDSTSLQVHLGIKDPAAFKRALADLLDPPDYGLHFYDAAGKEIKQPGNVARLNYVPMSLWDGGWVRGGSKRRGVDDVPLLGADGEFMVNVDAAKKWGPFLEQINAGRTPGPSALPAPVSTAGSGSSTIIYKTEVGPVYQQPGQSVDDLAAAIDNRIYIRGRR